MTTYATTRATSKTAKQDRIVVGGHDITYFRGKAIPVPSYRLLEPFGYGSATIVVPQVRPYLEAGAFGTGDLKWVKKGARVLIQRVDPDTQEITTDYRGIVVSIRAGGAELTLEVGGILTGPAGLRNKQVPVFRQVYDAGRWMAGGINYSGNFAGVYFTPKLGPATGIEIADTGGMTHLAWLQQICSLAVTEDGDQWTVMPKEPGSNHYEMRLKDYTTKHCTVWLDDARVVADLVDDAAEQFNTGFGSGVTNEGMIWDGTVLPLVEEFNPPPFPGTLQVGDSGDSVLLLHWKLIRSGFLRVKDSDPTFTNDTARAVKQLQDRAGLPETGVVNKATWNALFDVEALGFDISGARILPLVQRSKVRPWNYSAAGTRIGPNPDYDPHAIRVDRNIDFGAGVTEQQARRWMRGQMKRLGGKSWTGTITLNMSGAFLGEHNTPATATAAKLISARDIQAGWNVWVPNFDGGTLLHIADIQVNGDTVTLAVDTHYRDAIDLAAIRERDRESRRDLRREFIREYRGSKRIHDSVTPFNEKAGILYRDVACEANKWTVIPIFAGQAGTISKLRIVTNAAAEFCSAIFADKVGSKELMRRVGNPFPVDKDGETVWSETKLGDWFDSNFLLYSHGNEEQPGGYWPKKKTNRDRQRSDAPLTGVWQDNASFGYATFRIPALWLAVYPKAATTVKRGRVLWAQLEPGA